METNKPTDHNEGKTEQQLPPLPEVDMRAGHYLLKNSPLALSDAVRLTIEILEGSRAYIQGKNHEETLRHCREVVHLGLKEYELSLQTVSFKEAVDALLAYKNSVRERTLAEIRQVCYRLMATLPEWRDRPMRQIDTDYCQRSIIRAFSKVSMQRKVRRILHSVFSYAILNGWCLCNPLDLVVLPPYIEKPIRAMTLQEIFALLCTTALPRHVECAAAVGLMLWAGIRPTEVKRLHFRDISFEEGVITVPPTHSKTGGSRHVTLHPVLRAWLLKHVPVIYPDAPIVPPNWGGRWDELRKKAGFTEWVQDILRHTYASYHLKYFKDLNTLIMEMGHSTPQLLRTRYLAMDNVTSEAAKVFWEYGLPNS